MMAAYRGLSSGWAGQRSAFEAYYGVLGCVDRQIGRILEALRDGAALIPSLERGAI